MKKFLVLSTMAVALVVAASLAFAGTIFIPWFINDDFTGTYGEPGQGYDTWFVIKNVNATDTLTIYIEYYDNSDYLTVATTQSGTFLPKDVKAVYTGNVAGSGFTDDFGGVGYNMGTNCDKGSIVIYWADTGNPAKEDVQGYEGIEQYTGTWVIGGSMAVSFIY